MRKFHTCSDLGVCNSRHCSDVSACPNYDLLACNDAACRIGETVAAMRICPYAPGRFTARPGCAREAYTQPTYPFAPGIIDSGALSIVYLDDDGPWLPFSLAQTLKLLAVMLVLCMVAGYLVERFA